MTRHPSLLLLLLCLTGLTSLSLSRADTEAAPAAKPVRILNAHLGELPGLINADKTGPFVDLVRAIDDLYPEVSIRITIYPLARAMAGVIAGTADFSLPAIRNLQEADLMLRQLKLTNIHREHLGDFEDLFIIAKGPTGDETDRFLGEAIERLAASGKLAEIYSRLHRPYVEWQPHPEPLPAKDMTKSP